MANDVTTTHRHLERRKNSGNQLISCHFPPHRRSPTIMAAAGKPKLIYWGVKARGNLPVLIAKVGGIDLDWFVPNLDCPRMASLKDTSIRCTLFTSSSFLLHLFIPSGTSLVVTGPSTNLRLRSASSRESRVCRPPRS